MGRHEADKADVLEGVLYVICELSETNKGVGLNAS